MTAVQSMSVLFSNHNVNKANYSLGARGFPSWAHKYPTIGGNSFYENVLKGLPNNDFIGCTHVPNLLVPNHNDPSIARGIGFPYAVNMW